MRAVDPSTGATRTVAGVAWQAGSVDGVGAAARFQGPAGMWGDGAGHLYVADLTVVRRLDLATGAVSTLPGSYVGASAVVGEAGVLTIADATNKTLHKLVLATNELTTLAGQAGTSGTDDKTGVAATFQLPRSLALDGAGTLFVLDADRIRSVALSSAAVTTFLIDGYMRGLACDGSGGLLVTRGLTVQRISIATKSDTVLAGMTVGAADGVGPAAQFIGASGVTSDGAGTIFVADTDNQTIRKIVASTGAVTTLAGSPPLTGTVDGTGAAARFRGPTGLCHDGNGNLLVADFQAGKLRVVAAATGAVTTVPDPDGLLGPSNAVACAAGAAYVITGDGTILVYQANALRVLPIQGAAVSNVHAAVADGAGHLYIADAGNSDIVQVDVATGNGAVLAGMPGVRGTADGTGADARFSRPSGIALDGAGHLFVTDWGNGDLRRVDLATGAVTRIAGQAGMTGRSDGVGTAARFYNPAGLAYDAVTRRLYVADEELVRRVDVATGEVTTVLGVVGEHGVGPGPAPAHLNSLVGLALGPNGDLFLTDVFEPVLLRARRYRVP